VKALREKKNVMSPTAQDIPMIVDEVLSNQSDDSSRSKEMIQKSSMKSPSSIKYGHSVSGSCPIADQVSEQCQTKERKNDSHESRLPSSTGRSKPRPRKQTGAPRMMTTFQKTMVDRLTLTKKGQHNVVVESLNPKQPTRSAVIVPVARCHPDRPYHPIESTTRHPSKTFIPISTPSKSPNETSSCLSAPSIVSSCNAPTCQTASKSSNNMKSNKDDDVMTTGPISLISLYRPSGCPVNPSAPVLHNLPGPCDTTPDPFWLPTTSSDSPVPTNLTTWDQTDAWNSPLFGSQRSHPNNDITWLTPDLSRLNHRDRAKMTTDSPLIPKDLFPDISPTVLSHTTFHHHHKVVGIEEEKGVNEVMEYSYRRTTSITTSSFHLQPKFRSKSTYDIMDLPTCFASGTRLGSQHSITNDDSSFLTKNNPAQGSPNTILDVSCFTEPNCHLLHPNCRHDSYDSATITNSSTTPWMNNELHYDNLIGWKDNLVSTRQTCWFGNVQKNIDTSLNVGTSS
jgi:hypothetical protein